jgi:hypothetical protein
VLTADVLQRLLHVPHVPLQHAQQLVAAGVHISYAQVLEAASSMVAGVEVWVQAQQQLKSRNKKKRLHDLYDIPAEAVAICCGRARAWVSLHTAVCCHHTVCTQLSRLIWLCFFMLIMFQVPTVNALGGCLYGSADHA